MFPSIPPTFSIFIFRSLNFFKFDRNSCSKNICLPLNRSLFFLPKIAISIAWFFFCFSDVDKSKIKIVNNNGKKQEVNLPNKNTLFLELQEFADNCNNKKKYRVKNSEAAHNVKVMEAIVTSSKTNRKIFLS